ncbi:MAG TPA: aminotransferase class III-fold pyridoxal phosphate-dependent enzyme, partial [Polyangiaceae bacterium]|nr:aminotransferase class III-fold pyridoxal phosphate-dependent enzyme [Polyangiaceae bacterium]
MSRSQELPDVRVPPPGPCSRGLGARLAAAESPSVDARRLAREKDSGAEQAPIVYASAHGVNVVDADGNRYVDLAAGFGALLLGHARAEVMSAVSEQQRTLGLALGDVYGSEVKLALCERLAKLFPVAGARVMLGASGADAVTAALKTAVLATGRPGVVAFEGGYHGLSHGPLAVCGLRPTFREPFSDQLNAHVTFAPYPDASADASMAA